MSVEYKGFGLGFWLGISEINPMIPVVVYCGQCEGSGMTVTGLGLEVWDGKYVDLAAYLAEHDENHRLIVFNNIDRSEGLSMLS